ncbi:MAG: N-glycosylase/DNA lyase [archaeon]
MTGARSSLSIQRLLKDHSRKKAEIASRLSDFEKAGRLPEEEIFLELVFCLLTPQSRARAAEKAADSLRNKRFPRKSLPLTQIRSSLSGVRFPNNKARYVSLARRVFSEGGKISITPSLPLSNPLLSRKLLVARVKGLGMKEASHFLRNIGFGEDLAILDIHVLRRLVPLGILKEIPKSIPPKKYLELEEKLRAFSRKVKIPLAELDLLLWSDGTGEIFK